MKSVPSFSWSGIEMKSPIPATITSSEAAMAGLLHFMKGQRGLTSTCFILKLALPFFRSVNTSSSVTTITVKSVVRMPMLSVVAKPLIGPVPTM